MSQEFEGPPKKPEKKEGALENGEFSGWNAYVEKSRKEQALAAGLPESASFEEIDEATRRISENRGEADPTDASVDERKASENSIWDEDDIEEIKKIALSLGLPETTTFEELDNYIKKFNLDTEEGRAEYYASVHRSSGSGDWSLKKVKDELDRIKYKKPGKSK